jgi:hypothetical protein
MRGCSILCVLPESTKIITGRPWMNPRNLRVCGENCPVAAWGERLKYVSGCPFVVVSSKVSDSSVSSEISSSSGMRSRRKRPAVHL